MRFLVPLTLLVAAPVLGACAQNAPTGAADTGSGSITVDARDDACDISADTAEAGPLVFHVTNNGSKVTEFYLYSADGKRIVGEVENIGPGLDRTLTVSAVAGDYQTACKPGMAGQGIRSAFSVTGSAASAPTTPNADAALVERAQRRYTAWVARQSVVLLSRSRQFVAAYVAGHDDQARELYPRARTPWESIETVAESFGDLDPKTDAREADLQPGQRWTGWHRIEKDLWPQRDRHYKPLSIAQRRQYGADLLRNLTAVRGKIRGLEFTTDQIANGSAGLMEEVARTKVTGEEEYWSRTDLWDFQANLDGSRTAFELVRPVLHRRDPQLETTLAQRFAALQRLLDQHRQGTGFGSYDRLDRAQVKQLADSVNALSEPLSHLTAAVLP